MRTLISEWTCDICGLVALAGFDTAPNGWTRYQKHNALDKDPEKVLDFCPADSTVVGNATKKKP